MSNNNSDQKDRNIGKSPNQDKIIVADDDNVPHLENMANVQGSNKSAKNNTPNQNVEKEV